MGEKNVQIYAPEGMLFSDGAPLLVADGVLLSNKRSGKKFVRLRLKNISANTLNAVTVTIRPLDADGHGAWGDVMCPMAGLSVPRDGEFGQDKSFELLEGDVRSFDVLISEAAFDDGSVWTGSDRPWTALSPIRSLEDALGGGELADQFRIRYGSDCEYQPAAERGLWFCACGGINRADEAKCHLCRRTHSAQKAVNFASLKADCAQRLKTEREQHEVEAAKAAERKKKNLRRTVIIAPIALLLALFIAVLPGYIAGKKAYGAASALLSAGRYDEAEAAFEALGIYGDSREQARQNVPYQKALYILDCADQGSTPGLTLLGLRRSEFEDDEHMRMALYQGAAELFEELGQYKDSKARQVYAQDALNQLVEQLNSADYETASALLAQGAYLSARDGFAALGEYKDSADMALECSYLKAAALLDYIEKYSVRGVSAAFSDTAGTPDAVNIQKEALARLGEAAAAELRELLAGDGPELSFEDTAADMQPMCDGVNALFLALGSYKDSAALAERAALAGDFTRPFYEYCAKGELSAAASWLQGYDGDFTNRDGWLSTLSLYLSFCAGWELHRGDSTLIPLTVGAEGTCGSFEAAVLMDADGIPTLRVSFGSDGKYVELPAESGSIKFMSTLEDGSVYFASINNQNHFIYVKYNSDGAVVSSVEYARAAA